MKTHSWALHFYRPYSNSLLQLITITTQSLHAIRFKCTVESGKFKIISIELLARAAKVLYPYLVESKGYTKLNTLPVHVHKLLEVIIHSVILAKGH
jgi:hypothetical protein